MISDEEFWAWWTAFDPRIIALAERFLGSTDDAEDLRQDVVLAAYQKRARFNDRSHLEAWAVKRTQWLALNRLRSLRRLVHTDQVAAPAPGVDHELMLTLHEQVSGLPENQRRALVLTVAGHTTASIAQTMGVTEATVRSLRRHARRRLREAIPEEDQS